MSKDNVEVLEGARPIRRALLKGLLVGLGAGVLVQASGGVTAFAQEKTEPAKAERRGDKNKVEKSKVEKKNESKSKNEKRKAEESKAQRGK